MAAWAAKLKMDAATKRSEELFAPFHHARAGAA